ncbi:GNAT family N-acetyltransferase [Arthrobacter sp. NPDC058192]|uniref:GNAT family N-acetyltransferase n=1 Tax=Arthrobacter sp. NPDC058192 TaxID=3346372 RepID=UPI0036F05D1C
MDLLIRPARNDDLPRLRDIETAAGEAFRQIGMAAVADDAPPSLDALATYQRDGRAWVATNSCGEPIAYILVEIADGHAHISQVSVHPDHARQGVGGALIEEAARWAVERKLQGVTLTTFRDVPWNAPYYSRLGFVQLPEQQCMEDIRQILEAEKAHGLHAWPRVVMKKAATDS